MAKWLLAMAPRLGAVAEAIQTGKWDAVPGDQREVVVRFNRYFESELLKLTDAHGGTQQWLLKRSRGQIDQATMNAVVKKAMEAAVARLKAGP